MGEFDLINNPRFGIRYNTDAVFKRMVDLAMRELYPTLKMDVIGNDVKFMYEPLGNRRMGFEEALNEAQFNRTLKSTREYTGRYDTHFSGVATNERLNRIAQQGYQTRVSRHEFNTQDDLNSFLSSIKGADGEVLGFPVPRGDRGVNYIEIVDKDGKTLSFDKTSKLLSLSEGEPSDSIFKRLSIFTSEREMSLMRDEPFKVFTFDPKQLAKFEDPKLEAIVKSTLKRQAASGIGSLDEADLWKKMYDGENFMTQAMADQIIDDIRQRGQEFLDEARAIKPLNKNSKRYSDYLQYKAMGEKHLRIADEQELNIATNGRMNFRAINAVSQTGEIGSFKGDIGIITKAQEQVFKRAFGIDDLNQFDFFASSYDVKNEMLASPFASIEFHGHPREINTNVLSHMAHHSLLDPQGQTISGVQQVIAEDLDELRNGRLSPRFKSVLAEMANREIDPFSSIAEQAEARKAQQFARTVQRQIAAGMPIGQNEYTFNQLYSAMVKHYSVLESDKVIRFGGVSIPDYKISFPVGSSFGGHLTGGRLTSKDFVPIGTIRPAGNVIQTNRFDTMVRHYMAAGGPDWDDRFGLSLQYDPKAKRLLYLTTRAPDETAEFAYYNADISLDINIPQEIRNADAEFKSLTAQLGMSQKNPKAKAALRARRDELAEKLHSFFMEYDKVQKIDLAQTFGDIPNRPHFIATPKGFKRDNRYLRRYQKGSAVNSYMTSSEVASNYVPTAANLNEVFESLIRTETKRLSTDQGGNLPYKFTGENEWFDTYFRPLDLPSNVPSGSLEDRTVARIIDEFKTRGLLGRTSNINAAVDDMLQSYFEFLPDTLANKASELWKGIRPTRIEKEMAVDLAKKVGVASAFETIDTSLNELAQSWGSFTAQMQQEIEAYNSANGFNPGDARYVYGGMDPYVAQRRLGGFRDKFLEGYRSVRGINSIEDIYLPSDDPKAVMSRLLKQKAAIVTGLESGREAELDLVRQARLSEISDMKFSADELKRASEFISYMTEEGKNFKKLFDISNPEQLVESLQNILESGQELPDLNTSALRKLNQFGLFNTVEKDGLKYLQAKPELYRQLLAISKTLGENKSPIGMLMSVGAEEGMVGMEELFTAARQMAVTPKLLEEVKTSSLSELVNNFFQFSRRGNVSFSNKGLQFFDRAEGASAILNRILNERPSGESKVLMPRLNSIIDFLLSDMADSGQFDEQMFGLYRLSVPTSFKLSRNRRFNVRLKPPSYAPRSISTRLPGAARHEARAAADIAADAVSVGRDRMTLLDSAMVKKIWNQPIGKASILGMVGFVGIGLMHRLTKNPTPEDMGGPPLLPGGSAYEEYDLPPYADMSSMYPTYSGISSAGMRYTVTTSSGYDPHRLGNNLSTLTGASNYRLNVYNSRKVRNNYTSSSEIMKELRYD